MPQLTYVIERDGREVQTTVEYAYYPGDSDCDPALEVDQPVDSNGLPVRLTLDEHRRLYDAAWHAAEAARAMRAADRLIEAYELERLR